MISLVGFLLISVFIAYKKEMKLIYTIPLCTSGLLFILYFLAMIRKLKYIDAIGAIFILFFLVLTVVKRKTVDFKKIGALFKDGSFIALLSGIVFITIVVRGKLSSSWDDLSCWAYQIKTLFMLNGFNSKGMSPGLSYENYIPGQMLFSWWFCRFNPSNYYEGLMYAGYYSLFLIILAPLFSVFKFKKYGIIKALPLGILFSQFLLLFPSIINTSQYNMIAVEFSQGAAVGVLLILMLSTIDDIDENTREILWVSTIIILAFLKSSSLYFIIFFSFFALILRKVNKKDGIGIKPVITGFLFTAFINVTWKGFCTFSERGGVDTRGKSMLNLMQAYISNQSASSKETANKYADSFFFAINNYPLHIDAAALDSGFGINLTFFGVLVIILLCLFIFAKCNVYQWQKKELIGLEVFSAVSILLYAVSLLFMLMFFFNESAYVKPQAVIGTLSRYVEPVLSSFLFFILATIIFKISGRGKVIPLILVFLCFDYFTFFDGYFRYQDRSKNTISMHNDISNENAGLVDSISSKYNLRAECKVLDVIDKEDTNTYCHLRYNLAPKSIDFLPLDYYEIDDAKDYLLEYCEKNNDKAEIYFTSEIAAQKLGFEPDTLYSTVDALALLNSSK